MSLPRGNAKSRGPGSPSTRALAASIVCSVPSAVSSFTISPSYPASTTERPSAVAEGWAKGMAPLNFSNTSSAVPSLPGCSSLNRPTDPVAAAPPAILRERAYCSTVATFTSLTSASATTPKSRSELERSSNCTQAPAAVSYTRNSERAFFCSSFARRYAEFAWSRSAYAWCWASNASAPDSLDAAATRLAACALNFLAVDTATACAFISDARRAFSSAVMKSRSMSLSMAPRMFPRLTVGTPPTPGFGAISASTAARNGDAAMARVMAMDAALASANSAS